MMKTILTLLLATALVSGCTTMATLATIDLTIKQTTPAACKAITAAYNGYVASGHGSIRDKEVIAQAYGTTTAICADPTHVTAGQVAVVAYQLAMIAKTLKRTKANG